MFVIDDDKDQYELVHEHRRGVAGGVAGVRASSKDVDNNATVSDNVGKL